MSRIWRLKPGDPFPRVGSGDTVLLEVGAKPHRPFSLRGVRGVRVESGSETWANVDARGAEFGVRIHDGCDDLTVKRLNIRGAAHGMKITASDRVLVSQCEFSECGVEGFLAGGCEDLVVSDCWSTENGRGLVPGYRPDQGHGFYVSWGSRNVELLRCIARENRGSGIQLNGTPAEGMWLERARIEACDLWENGCDGTPALSLMAVRDCRVLECELRHNNAGVVLYDDGSRGFSPRGVRFEGVHLYEPAGKFAVRLIGDCRDIEFVDCRIVTGRPEAIEGNPRLWTSNRCEFLTGGGGVMQGDRL